MIASGSDLRNARHAAFVRLSLVSVLLACGFLVQVHFLSTYPQPILFGDPGAYYVVGQKLQQAAGRLRVGESLEAVFESVRGLLYFTGVGSLYASIDALRPHDIPFFRVVLTGFNSLAMLGCFILGRQLGGRFAGGLVALGLASIYPSFSVQTGRLFPDPVTGCFLVWSAAFYALGVERRNWRWMFTAGLSLTAALFIRCQLFSYVLFLLVVALVASSPFWFEDKTRRRGAALALVAGCLPLTFAWISIVGVVGDDLSEIEQLGNFTFKQQYPYGFWQFLDSDGWMGPYRLRQEPYYQAMEEAARRDPEDLETRFDQWAFTARYVASRWKESLLLVLDNGYRLYDRPANDYKWDYPFAYSLQVLFQKAILLLGLAGLAASCSRVPACLGVFFVPLSLGLLHGFSYPWPRFNQPAMPIWIASAGAFVAWTALRGSFLLRRPWRPVLSFAAAATLLFFFGEHLLLSSLPDAARAAGWLARLSLVAIPFLIVAGTGTPTGRRAALWAAGTGTSLAILVTAHTLRDTSWHELRLALGKAPLGVEQEIHLSAQALAQLRSAHEAFVVFDVVLPPNAVDAAERVTVAVNDHGFSGSQLVGTMPRFGESTLAGGRDRRGYRQWWALPLTEELLPVSAPALIRVKLRATDGTDIHLYADRFEGQDRFYEGPSFGDWPHLTQVKLEYDGDYRLPVRVPLQSARTRSYVYDRTGERLELFAAHRIRIIALRSNQGHLVWESRPLPPDRPAALVFFAYSGTRGQAELLVNGQPILDFPLGSLEDFRRELGPYRLCYRAEPPRGDMAYGGYTLILPEGRGEPAHLEVRFRSGMSAESMFFSLDTRKDGTDVAQLAGGCDPPPSAAMVDGVGRIIDASRNSYPGDTGRWSVAAVF